ncbi:hypothetical protein FA95DRAFT_1194768 [Auriscalpium vulgare]|uniref:Uncharacterized protein n=1 Tax=Auriscalpium vulgare TaxID=40419 RepID=A0ACB8R3K0_9AGAM|nr:hypothetical protein FA95DRAFT_1194768 [Auriscalpium vulgare]
MVLLSDIRGEPRCGARDRKGGEQEDAANPRNVKTHSWVTGTRLAASRGFGCKLGGGGELTSVRSYMAPCLAARRLLFQDSLSCVPAAADYPERMPRTRASHAAQTHPTLRRAPFALRAVVLRRLEKTCTVLRSRPCKRAPAVARCMHSRDSCGAELRFRAPIPVVASLGEKYKPHLSANETFSTLRRVASAPALSRCRILQTISNILERSFSSAVLLGERYSSTGSSTSAGRGGSLNPRAT